MKRLLDIILSTIALIALLPFLFPVVVILKFTGEGEVFYIQKRVGLAGNIFGLYKFATMLKDSPNIGAGEITLKGDPRVLPFGTFLRKTKINELPQIWNILVGDMSVVGPRPMVPNTYAHYPDGARSKLDKIRPGLTGVGSIVFRDEERYLMNTQDPMAFYRTHIIPHKSDLECWYVDNDSVWLYLKIIVVTAWVVLFPTATQVESLFDGLPPRPEALK